MAITQVGTATTAATTSTGTVTVNKPTGVASGDVMVATFAVNEGTITASGWTAVDSRTDTPNNTFGAYLYYKVAGGSEPSNYTFSTSSTSAPMPVVVTAWRGVDTINPIPQFSSQVGGSVGSGINPDPETTFSQTDQGLLFYARSSRAAVSPTPVFTNSSGSWTLKGQIGEWSGGTARYSTSQTWHNTETGAGGRTEPTVTANTDTTDNVYVLGYLKAAPEGAATATIGAVTSSLAGYHRIDAALGASLAPVSFSGDGIAAPPSGTLDTALAPITSSFAGNSIGGSFESTLAPVTSAFEGSVNPIGSFECSIAPVTSQFVSETAPQGEHVIKVEADHRAFSVVDAEDGTGLIPIKRSQVTQA